MQVWPACLYVLCCISLTAHWQQIYEPSAMYSCWVLWQLRKRHLSGNCTCRAHHHMSHSCAMLYPQALGNRTLAAAGRQPCYCSILTAAPDY
jgi:hypothetical protein